MRLSKPADRLDPLKSLKAWYQELNDHGEGSQTLQYELVDALLSLRYQAHKDGWMNWSDNQRDMVDFLFTYLPGGHREAGIRRDLEAIRESGETGADEGRMAYDELDRLLGDLMSWCDAHREWIGLPEGYVFWSDVPPGLVAEKLAPRASDSLFQRLMRRWTAK